MINLFQIKLSIVLLFQADPKYFIFKFNSYMKTCKQTKTDSDLQTSTLDAFE